MDELRKKRWKSFILEVIQHFVIKSKKQVISFYSKRLHCKEKSNESKKDFVVFACMPTWSSMKHIWLENIYTIKNSDFFFAFCGNWANKKVKEKKRKTNTQIWYIDFRVVYIFMPVFGWRFSLWVQLFDEKIK